MRNRAKCKLCNDIIESYHATDTVTCKCGELTLCDGDSMRVLINDWSNLIRVDDEGNEIVPKVVDHANETLKCDVLLDMLDLHIKSFDNLPDHARMAPVTNIDMQSALMIIHAILKADK